jgi:hypothetical protein
MARPPTANPPIANQPDSDIAHGDDALGHAGKPSPGVNAPSDMNQGPAPQFKLGSVLVSPIDARVACYYLVVRMLATVQELTAIPTLDGLVLNLFGTEGAGFHLYLVFMRTHAQECLGKLH